MWAYACRGEEGEEARCAATLGAELAKDLDAAYRNAYLCAAVESDALEVSLRIHADAWYDGQNLVNARKKEGLDAWLAILLNELEGFRLRLADWKGEWLCGALTAASARGVPEVLQARRARARRSSGGSPAPPGARGAGARSARCRADWSTRCVRLVPLYRYIGVVAGERLPVRGMKGPSRRGFSRLA